MNIIFKMLQEAGDYAEIKHAAARKIHDLTVEIGGIEGQIKVRESELLAEVCAERDEETGKPVYSNAEARQGAVTMRSMTDDALVQLSARRDDLRRDLSAAQADRERAHDLHRAHLAAMNALGD
jgi:hypothetical protein